MLIDQCFADIPTDKTVIVAVSGGSDSVALLLMANAWAIKNKVVLQAITIDHGLRPEAAVEAAFVASICAAIDVDHVTLAWEGAKPVLGIQNAARQSRYSLLDQYAKEIGSDIILTGHTLNDQAETIYMRLQRHRDESDGKGLSGMSRRTWLCGGTQIYRPLLGVSRVTLRRVLNDFSQSWIEDPSNLDESFERVRVRKKLEAEAELTVKYLALANLCGRFRRVAVRDCAGFLRANVSLQPGPVFDLELPCRVAGNVGSDETMQKVHPVVLHGVQILIGVAGGGEYLTPRWRILPLLAKLMARDVKRVNIGGVVIERSGVCYRIYREARNLASLALEAGDETIWDGRLYLHNDTAETVFVEAVKRSQILAMEKRRGAEFEVKPRQALWSMPVLHCHDGRDGEKTILPMLDGFSLPVGLHARLAAPAIEHFCPDFDEPLRDWVLSLKNFSVAYIAPKSL